MRVRQKLILAIQRGEKGEGGGVGNNVWLEVLIKTWADTSNPVEFPWNA